MRGDFVKLVEETLNQGEMAPVEPIVEALPEINTAVQTATGKLLEYLSQSGETFKAELLGLLNTENGKGEVPPYYLVIDGKIRPNVPSILQAADLDIRDATMNYANEESVKGSVKKILGPMKDALDGKLGEIFATEERKADIVDALIREFLVALMSKVTIESKLVDEERIREIIINEIG
jgi:hypothetical protein